MLRIGMAQAKRFEHYQEHQFIQKVVNLIEGHFPKRTRRFGRAHLPTLVADTIKQAAAYNIFKERNVCKLAGLRLVLGIDFHTELSWAHDILASAQIDEDYRLFRLYALTKVLLQPRKNPQPRT